MDREGSSSNGVASGPTVAGKGKGKGRGSRDETIARGAGESAVAATGDGIPVGEEPSSDFVEIEEGTRVYTTDEMIARMRFLSERVGVTLDRDYYDNLIAQRVSVDLAKARGDASLGRGSGGLKDSSGGGGGSSSGAAAAAATAAPRGKGKRKSSGTHAEDTAGAAEDKKETEKAASGGVRTTPTPAANPSNRKRRLQDSDEEDEDAASEPVAPQVKPSSIGDPPRGSSRQQGAGDSGATWQGQGAKRQKGGQTTAAAADACDDDFSCGGSVGGDGTEDEHFSCGGSDFDDKQQDGEPASVLPPPRPPSSRREGASKPAQERALARALLGKDKAVNPKLKDKTPISAGSGSGCGSAYLIPKKANATGEAPSALSSGGGGGSGGSASGGAMSSIPRKAIPKKSR